MKIYMLKLCAILSILYLELGAFAKQLERKGEAPKTTKQKNREDNEKQLRRQKEAEKRAAEEKRKRAEREAEEQRQLAERILLDKWHEALLREMNQAFIGNETESVINKVFFPSSGDLLAAEQQLRLLISTRDWRLLELAIEIDAEKYAYIRNDTDTLEISRTGSGTAIDDFSRGLAYRIGRTTNAEGLFIFSPNAVQEWHRKRNDRVRSIVQEELESYFLWLKDQRKFKPFWRGATLGLGSIGNFAVNESTIQNILRRNYLYADTNLLFWSFLRIGPYVAGDVQKGTLEKFGGSFEFVFGGPRAALLLGSRFGGARQHPIGSLRNAITPSAGFEVALGLPVALFFKYEAEFLQTDIGKFERNDQYNVGMRFRHYSNDYFSKAGIGRDEAVGSPIINAFSNLSVRIGAHFSHAPRSTIHNTGIYEIGLQTGRQTNKTGLVLGYAFTTESIDARLQRHMPHIGVTSPRIGDVTPEVPHMDFGIMLGPVLEQYESDKVTMGAVWLQMRIMRLFSGFVFGYMLHFGTGGDFSRYNAFTFGVHLTF